MAEYGGGGFFIAEEEELIFEMNYEIQGTWIHLCLLISLTQYPCTCIGKSENRYKSGERKLFDKKVKNRYMRVPSQRFLHELGRTEGTQSSGVL